MTLARHSLESVHGPGTAYAIMLAPHVADDAANKHHLYDDDGHEMFPSISTAVDYFRSEVAGIDYGTGTDEQIMDLYPQCETSAGLRCHSGATFHDYPMVRYQVGPRGGVVRVNT